MCSTLYFVITMIFLIRLPVNNSLPFPSDEIEWPSKCNGTSYCHIKPANYPTEHVEKLLQEMTLDFSHFSDLGNRSSEDRGTDVADCAYRVLFEPLYLIKDDNDQVRIVPQRERYLVIVRIEECRNPGRVYHASNLKTELLLENRVDCVEIRLPMDFPVVSLDGTHIESAPVKGGIPMRCSGKLMENV